MNAVPPEAKAYVYKLCLLWGIIITSWTVLHVSTPLIVKDIDPSSAAVWQGVFLSTNAFVGGVFCGVGGFYSDYVGRVEVLKPWVLYYATTTVALVISDRFKLIFPLWYARTSAISIPSTILHAFFSDFLTGDALLQSYGYIGATMGVSSLFGSLLCGLLSRWSRQVPLGFACLLGMVSAGMTLTLRIPPNVQQLSRTKGGAMAQSGYSKDVNSKIVEEAGEAASGAENVEGRKALFQRAMRIITHDHLLLCTMLAAVILRVAIMNTNLMLVLFLNYRLGWGLTEVSYVLAFTALVTIVAQSFGMKLLIAHDVIFPALIIFLLAGGTGIMCYALVFDGVAVYIVHLVIGVGIMATSILNARVTSIASPWGISGIALGMVGTIHNACEVFFALLFGFLLKWSMTTYPSNSILCGVPFMINGITVYGSCALVWCAQRRYGREHHTMTSAAVETHDSRNGNGGLATRKMNSDDGSSCVHVVHCKELTTLLEDV